MTNAAVTEPENRLENNVQHLKRLAVKRGADDAVVISAADVIVDPRVRFKCMIPRCYMSGSCGHCPPHGYSTQQTRDIVSGYGRAVFFRVGVKSTIIAADNVHEAIESGVMDAGGHALNLGGYYILVFSIVKILQKTAEAEGYRTHGFAAGNCRDPFCHLRPVCQSLMTDRGCRHPNLSSFSMESTGMDVYRMAARVGWQQYPIGGSCQPDSVPRGSLMGLVLVGQKKEG